MFPLPGRLVKNSYGVVSAPAETNVRISLPVVSTEADRAAFTSSILSGASVALGKGDLGGALALATGAAATMNLFTAKPVVAGAGGAGKKPTREEIAARVRLREDLLDVVEQAAVTGRPTRPGLEARISFSPSPPPPSPLLTQ